MSKVVFVCGVAAIGVCVMAGSQSGAGVLKRNSSAKGHIAGPFSTVPFATFSTNKNGGTTVVVSDHGNVLNFESPSGYGHIFHTIGKGEGYILCYTGVSPVQAFDLGTSENTSAWSSTTSTPGPPVQVKRVTADGSVQFDQAISFNGARRALTIKMTLKNIGAQAITSVKLRRQVDFDVDRVGSNGWALSTQNVWGADSHNAVFAFAPKQNAPAGREAHTMMLHATSGDATSARITTPPATDACNPAESLPPQTGDFGGTLVYDVGTLAVGKTKSFMIEYIRP
jgi:hypothetical protein